MGQARRDGCAVRVARVEWTGPLLAAGRRANARSRARRWDQALVPASQNSGRITRRHLIAAGGSAGVAAFVALNPQVAAAASAFAGDPAHLRRSTYLPLMGQQFSLGWWGSSSSVMLASIADLPYLKGREDAFSLTFLGEAATPPEGAPVALRHPKLGRFELFLAPIGRETDMQRYEAVINRSHGVKRGKPPKPKGGGKPPKKHRSRGRKNVLRDARREKR
jgi:Domain of unknown function (DUF6916)